MVGLFVLQADVCLENKSTHARFHFAISIIQSRPSYNIYKIHYLIKISCNIANLTLPFIHHYRR